MLALHQGIIDVAIAGTFIAIAILLIFAADRIPFDTLLDYIDPRRRVARHPSATARPTGLVRLIHPDDPPPPPARELDRPALFDFELHA